MKYAEFIRYREILERTRVPDAMAAVVNGYIVATGADLCKEAIEMANRDVAAFIEKIPDDTLVDIMDEISEGDLGEAFWNARNNKPSVLDKWRTVVKIAKSMRKIETVYDTEMKKSVFL